MPKLTQKKSEIAILAEEYYKENAAMNACKRKADKARAQLHKVLVQHELTNFVETIDIDGKPLTVSITIDEPKREVVDVMLLKKLIDAETFFKLAKVSKSDLIEECGDAVAMRVVVEEKGKQAVYVKVKK